VINAIKKINRSTALVLLYCILPYKLCLKVQGSLTDLQLYDSEFQTEGALMLKVFANNAFMMQNCHFQHCNTYGANCTMSVAVLKVTI